MTYIVERKCWLGRFKPVECRGIVDVTNGDSFMVSHLPIGEVPIVRDECWQEIESPEEAAAQIRGSLVTSERYEIDGSSVSFDGIAAAYSVSGSVTWSSL